MEKRKERSSRCPLSCSSPVYIDDVDPSYAFAVFVCEISAFAERNENALCMNSYLDPHGQASQRFCKWLTLRRVGDVIVVADIVRTCTVVYGKLSNLVHRVPA